MDTRWDRYFKQQQKDPETKDLVEKELAILRLAAKKIRSHTQAIRSITSCLDSPTHQWQTLETSQ
jgi:hypothetical protein